MQPFSTWLKDELKQRGLNYSDLGQRSGIPARPLAMILSGLRRPNAKALARIAQALDLPLEAVALQVQVPAGGSRPEATRRPDALLEQLDNPLLAAFLGLGFGQELTAPQTGQPAYTIWPAPPRPKARARCFSWDSRRQRRKR